MTEKLQKNKIAVLMATFNGAKFIEAQIESILKQKDIILDLFFSDDASLDDTVLILKNYAVKYSNVNIINEQRVGGPAKNFYTLIKTINANDYDYVVLADQDDLWPEYRISRGIDQLKFHQADAYSSDVIAVDEQGQIKKIIKKSSPQKKFDYIFETPGPGCSFIFNRHFCQFLQTQLNEKILNFPYHDWLIYALARQNKFKWIIDDAPNLFYRQHEHNFMGANFGLRSRLKRLNRILFGEYYKELIQLYSILNPNRRSLNFLKVWFFIINFMHTRRKFRHALLMIPFLLIVSIQKNEI
jgi:rhamnosyltransferase